MEAGNSSSPGPVMDFLGHVAYEFSLMQPMLPTYAHLILSAIFPIYTAAHASLSRPSSAAKSKKAQRTIAGKDGAKDGSDSEDEDQDSNAKNLMQLERFSPSDAIVLPVASGLTLGGLYFLIKYLKDLSILNKILNIYFTQMGMFLAMKFGSDAMKVLRSFVFPSQYSRQGYLWRVRGQRFQAVTADEDVDLDGKTRVSQAPTPALRWLRIQKLDNFLWSLRSLVFQKATFRAHMRSLFSVRMKVDLLDVLATVTVPMAMTYYTFIAKPWWLTNFIGFSFSYQAIQFMVPSTFWTGTLILAALFCYDIYMVFFTPLMVTVATKLDVPVKLVFPRPDLDDPTKSALAMLGLGDVVLPGMMIAFALRYDLWLFYEKKRLATGAKGPYQSVTSGWGEYFWTNRKSLKPDLVASFGAYADRSFPKTYFNASMIGYLLGLTTTIIVMQIFDHAQPALLYLVPGVLISLWGTSLVKGEVKTMWKYVDEDPEDEKKDEDSDKGKEKKPTEGNGEQSTVASTEAPEKQKSKEKIKKRESDPELFVFSLTLPRKLEYPPGESLEATGSTSSLLLEEKKSKNELRRRSSRRRLDDNGEPLSKRLKKEVAAED